MPVACRPEKILAEAESGPPFVPFGVEFRNPAKEKGNLGVRGPRFEEES